MLPSRSSPSTIETHSATFISTTVPWLSLLSGMPSLLCLSLLVGRLNLSISVICPRACKTCSMLAAIGQNTSAPPPCELVFHAMTLEPNTHVSNCHKVNRQKSLLQCSDGTKVLQSRLLSSHPSTVPSRPYNYVRVRVLAMEMGLSRTWLTQAAHLWLKWDSSQWKTVQDSNHSPACFTPRRARHCGSIVQHFHFIVSFVVFLVSTSSRVRLLVFLI